MISSEDFDDSGLSPKQAEVMIGVIKLLAESEIGPNELAEVLPPIIAQCPFLTSMHIVDIACGLLARSDIEIMSDSDDDEPPKKKPGPKTWWN